MCLLILHGSCQATVCLSFITECSLIIYFKETNVCRTRGKILCYVKSKEIICQLIDVNQQKITVGVLKHFIKLETSIESLIKSI